MQAAPLEGRPRHLAGLRNGHGGCPFPSPCPGALPAGDEGSEDYQNSASIQQWRESKRVVGMWPEPRHSRMVAFSWLAFGGVGRCPSLGHTVRGSGRDGCLGDLGGRGQVGSPEARPADPTAELLVHQWLQQLDRGRTSFGSTVASEVGSSWPTAHPAAWTELHLPCSGQDGPLADCRGEGTDTPPSAAFPVGCVVPPAETGLG